MKDTTGNQAPHIIARPLSRVDRMLRHIRHARSEVYGCLRERPPEDVTDLLLDALRHWRLLEEQQLAAHGTEPF